MFPGSPLLHPDNDQWKHMMFTNAYLYFSTSAVGWIMLNISIKNVRMSDLFIKNTITEMVIW